MISPEFWNDDKLSDLPIGTRLVFISTWSYADDEGYYEENLKRMKVVLFPYDKIDLKGHIAKLTKTGFIEIWKDKETGIIYHKIKNFKKWQKLNRPTESHILKLLETHGILTDDSRNTHFEGSNRSEVKEVKEVIEEKRSKTDIQLIVLAYKQAKGFEENDKAWDKQHFGRSTKAAKDLLDILGDVISCTTCINQIKDKMETAKPDPLSWTLETVCRHSHEYKKNLKSKVASEEAARTALEETKKWEEEHGFNRTV